MMLIAYIHPPEHVTGKSYSGRYAISVDGEKIVTNSRDPECDMARALLTRGHRGRVRVLDTNTGKHRSTVDIEKAALVTVKEDGTPRFAKYKQAPLDRSPAGETGAPGITPAEAA
jgi:hypothetical protein